MTVAASSVGVRELNVVYVGQVEQPAGRFRQETGGLPHLSLGVGLDQHDSYTIDDVEHVYCSGDDVDKDGDDVDDGGDNVDDGGDVSVC